MSFVPIPRAAPTVPSRFSSVPVTWWVPAALASMLGYSFVAAAGQSAPDQTAMLKRVDAHYNHLTSLRCDFTEHFTGLGVERTERGTLQLAKPGRMRWSYTDPAGKLFVLDGRFAWSYLPGDAQVQRVPAKQLDDLRSPLRFLLGRTKLETELLHASITPEGHDFLIEGVPRGLEQRVSRLSLRVSAAGGIEQIRLEERDGSVTEFLFQNAVENQPLPADTFHFEVPPGLPIVDAMPPI